MTNPAGNVANKNKKTIGKYVIIFACNGSGGVGFNLVCKNIVKAIKIGHTPINKNDGGVKSSKPNRLKTVVGAGADKSSIHP